MSENEQNMVYEKEVPLWFHDGRYGKIKATVFNNYVGAFEAGKWYAIHQMSNGSWLYRLDEATDEKTAREHSLCVINEGGYIVVAAQVLVCLSAPSPTQAIVHHAPTDATRPVLFIVEGELGPINIDYLH